VDYVSEEEQAYRRIKKLDGPLKRALESMGLLNKLELKAALAKMSSCLPEEIRGVARPVDVVHGELLLETESLAAQQEITFYSEAILDAAEAALGYRPREIRYRLREDE